MDEFLSKELENICNKIEKIERDIEFLWKEIKEIKKR